MKLIDRTTGATCGRTGIVVNNTGEEVDASGVKQRLYDILLDPLGGAAGGGGGGGGGGGAGSAAAAAAAHPVPDATPAAAMDVDSDGEPVGPGVAELKRREEAARKVARTCGFGEDRARALLERRGWPEVRPPFVSPGPKQL